MPRRAAALATPAASTPLTDATHNQQPDHPFVAELSLLRRQWKWAAFSQFFYTFSNLFAIPDVSLTDIEDDLTRSTSIVIHRVVHRLLVSATQDRKLSLENWQTALRKQYKKRDPHLNPIGPEPDVQLPTPGPDSPAGPDDEEIKVESASTPDPSLDVFPGNVRQPDADDHEFMRGHSGQSSTDVKLDEMKVEFTGTDGSIPPEPEQESKDWLTLPMLTKLDSLHLLTEWQFHNVNRLRTIMKDDDETAQWRIEPIGYDTKANAYWLIGPDRLWIQRAIPKPPRSLKRKHASTKPKPRRPIVLDDDESDAPPTPKKRKAAHALRRNTIKIPAVTHNTPTRSSRARRPPSSPEDLGPIANRGPRAAKMQASAKLSAQAKELAELQRQAALEARRSGKRVASPSPSPPRKGSPVRPMGTRMSARLRGVAQADDEWQEIPDEWLNEGNEVEEDGGASGDERLERDGVRSDPDPRPESEPEPDADTDAHRAKTGLESDDDAVSELTELSENSPPAAVVASSSKPRKASKKSGSRKKSNRSKRQTLTVEDSVPAVQPLENRQPEEEEVEPAWRPPDDFVEWETICVTLYEWEHICERFEGATHYSEKALYKLLSQHIVPAITAELREIQRKRQLDDAVSQRKRSSRLAMKESEKEEARVAAMRKAEEEEKLSRVRRLEARQKREEDERLKREAAREKRRLDREERERKAQAGEEETTRASSSVDVVEDGRAPPPLKPPKAKPGRPRTKAVTQPSASASATASGSRTPVGEDWVLDCEICHRTGVNKDDGSPLLCCGKCQKWQHIACHDLADRRAGHPKRDWDAEEFVCSACQRRSGSAVNGKQVPNGSAASSYDAGRTPSPYRHHQPGHSGQVPYGSNYHPRSSHQQHAAITFTHYQPEQRGFSTATTQSPAHAHAQPMPQMPAHAQTFYANSTHGMMPSKLAQYQTPQYPPHAYPNGNTNWPTASTSPAQASAASWPAHAPTGYATAAAYGSSTERSSSMMMMSGPYTAAAAGPTVQNGNPATTAATQSQPWRGNPYVAPVGGVSYYPQGSQSSQPPQHRAP